MTNTDMIARLDALNQAVERADFASVEAIGPASVAGIIQTVSSTPEIAQGERQAKARIGYLERAIRSNGAAASTSDIEKLRRRAGRAVVALRDLLETSSDAAATAAA